MISGDFSAEDVKSTGWMFVKDSFWCSRETGTCVGGSAVIWSFSIRTLCWGPLMYLHFSMFITICTRLLIKPAKEYYVIDSCQMQMWILFQRQDLRNVITPTSTKCPHPKAGLISRLFKKICCLLLYISNWPWFKIQSYLCNALNAIREVPSNLLLANEE
jgi:hypothetical protein